MANDPAQTCVPNLPPLPPDFQYLHREEPGWSAWNWTYRAPDGTFVLMAAAWNPEQCAKDAWRYWRKHLDPDRAKPPMCTSCGRCQEPT